MRLIGVNRDGHDDNWISWDINRVCKDDNRVFEEMYRGCNVTAEVADALTGNNKALENLPTD